MKTMIYENKSLQFLINGINTGLIDFETIESIEISSKNKPDCIIKILDIDTTKYILSNMKDFISKNKIKKTETSFFDFIVFMKVDSNESESSTLLVTSLLELISISNEMMALNENKIESQSEKENEIKDVDEVLEENNLEEFISDTENDSKQTIHTFIDKYNEWSLFSEEWSLSIEEKIEQ